MLTLSRSGLSCFIRPHIYCSSTSSLLYSSSSSTSLRSSFSRSSFHALAANISTCSSQSSVSTSTRQLIPKCYYGTTPTNPVGDEFAAGDEHGIIGAKLIPLVNKLQEVFAITGTVLDLPQLVVIGSQSSGKSSVLENLVGRDFLPRGTGIVTRRPLVLQLNRVEGGKEEWGEFSHAPNEKYHDFNKIREEIERETIRLTGKNKAVMADPIVLKIFSPNVIPLTLVDTPGIARVAVGDQPSNIEEQIKDMVIQYVKPNNSIILAVSPANQDLATSDGLKLAREVDPEGKRTVGVITKVDLMDQGTNALDILEGRILPLRLGYIGVVSRSQKDIQIGKTIRQMLSDEQQFFKKNSFYKHLADRCGTRFLAMKCNKLLTEHIEATLPQVKTMVLNEIRQTKAELELWGGNYSGVQLSSSKDKGWMLLQMLNNFAIDFRDALQGNLPTLSTGELNGGARVGYIFYETYGRQLNSITPDTALTTSEYRTALRNAAGSRPSLFVPETAFETLIRKQIERLRDPSLQCSELVLNELLRIVTQLETKDMIRFQTLRDKVVEVCSNVLRKCLGPTNQMIHNIINCELAYINTSHPDFNHNFMNKQIDASATEPIKEEPKTVAPPKQSGGFLSAIFGGGTASKKHDSERPTAQHPRTDLKLEEPPADLRVTDTNISPNEQRQIALIKTLLRTYFEITTKNVQDSVIKAIWHFLVEKSQTELHRSLVAELYKPELLDTLLRESSSVISRREELQIKLDALKKAKKILQVTQLRDFENESSPLL